MEEQEYQIILEQAKKYSYIKNYIIDNRRMFSINNPSIEGWLSNLYNAIGDDTIKMQVLQDENESAKFLTVDNCALFNSLYRSSSSECKSWYYINETNVPMDQSSILFGKGLFITSKDDDVCDKFYYRIDDISDYNNLVKFELSTICWSNFSDVAEPVKEK
jgi:hypothetical protein